MSENNPVDPYDEDYDGPRDGDVVGRINPWFSNSTYDKLKFLALVLLPAFGTLYFSIAATTGLPYGDEVVGVVLAIDTFLGVILGLSSSQYKRQVEGPVVGFMDVRETANGKKVDLNFPGDPNDIDQHDKVTFKVRKLN